MRRSPWPGIVCLAAILLGLWVVAHARYSTDLSAFLPSAPDVRQRLLVKLLRDGPASQLLLISIEGADASTRAQLSARLAATLRDQPEFATVANGQTSGIEKDSAVLFRNRYLLSHAVTPERFGVPGLTQAMQEAMSQQGAMLGLTGADGKCGLSAAAPAHRTVDGNLVDLGRVGIPAAAADVRLLDTLVRNQFVPVIASIGVARIAPGTPHIQYQNTSEMMTSTGLIVNRRARSIGVTVSPSTR